ncbi:MAG: heavy-metal-associated domain-containing protein [Acidithiobacillus sp.]|nr:heavy-metal-associated domain-containing protein [Acidithiobacillus sp.]
MTQIILKITGMTCQHCVQAVNQALRSVPGVEQVEVNLDTGTAVIQGTAERDRLIAAVTEEGYAVE